MSDLIINADMSGNGEPPKIEFPCRYPIKVVGRAEPEFEPQVISAVRTLAPGFSDADVSSRASSKGRFSSITIFITATGEDQLGEIFTELKKISSVKMVL